jgi:hypothetical protein
MLAPFLDKMVTHEVSQRFTAPQALEFLRELCSTLSPAELQIGLRGRLSWIYEPGYDKWSGLPPNFVKEWASFRIPELPLLTKVLRWICCFDLGRGVVRLARRVWRWWTT